MSSGLRSRSNSSEAESRTLTRSGFEREAVRAESWMKAIGSLTAIEMLQAPILCGEFSGGWLLCGGIR